LVERQAGAIEITRSCRRPAAADGGCHAKRLAIDMAARLCLIDERTSDV